MRLTTGTVLLADTPNLRLCKYPLKVVLVAVYCAMELDHHFEPNNFDGDYCFFLPRMIDVNGSGNPHQYRYEDSKELYPAPQTKMNAHIGVGRTLGSGRQNCFHRIMKFYFFLC